MSQRRMIIVANRLPVTRSGRGLSARWASSAGGLVSAVRPVLQRFDGVWVGWTGNAGRSPAPFSHDRLSIRPVPMTEGEIDGFYHGFCNSTVWPLFHDAIRTPDFRREHWETYQRINERFARTAARVAQQRDLVWIHDYQLLLAAGMLRERRPRARIGFFLHIPFPPEELFAWLPWRQTILRSMLGADLLGFQTAADAQNFARVARRCAPAEGTDSEIEFHGRRIRVGSFPISIDFREFERVAAHPDTIRRSQVIRARIGMKRRIILSVDRLDYTKGIEHRLLAFEELLRRGAVGVDECVMVQVAVPSREAVVEYQEIRTRIEQLVGRINGEYSQPGQVAVHYFRRSVTREELIAYYRSADVMLVTPLRDGMNLVAKEYVATRVDNSGVLVLSEFAGASRELRRALLVNPRDIHGTATMIQTALRLPPGEARKRMIILRMIVRRHDVHDWADSYLEALAG